jgi:hypothetical protein
MYPSLINWGAVVGFDFKKMTHSYKIRQRERVRFNQFIIFIFGHGETRSSQQQQTTTLSKKNHYRQAVACTTNDDDINESTSRVCVAACRKPIAQVYQ